VISFFSEKSIRINDNNVNFVNNVNKVLKGSIALLWWWLGLAVARWSRSTYYAGPG